MKMKSIRIINSCGIYFVFVAVCLIGLMQTEMEFSPIPIDYPSAKLGDGCYHVFLDVGANRGVHGRFLFEPQKYPKSKAVKLFEEWFGSPDERDNRLVCVFAFEPNPAHYPELRRKAYAYSRLG